MEERKQKIIDAAKALFSEKGYAGTGLREIAERAGVSLGNIYNYFKNKEEIFSSIFNPEEIGITLLESFQHIAGDFPFNIGDVILAIKQTVDRNIDLYRLYYIDLIEFGGRNTNKVYDYFLTLGKSLFRDQLDKKIQDGRIRDLDYDFLSRQFLISMIAFFSSIHQLPALKIENYSDGEISGIIAEVLLNGIVKK
jgi:AcrR family transcriptional regulator